MCVHVESDAMEQKKRNNKTIDEYNASWIYAIQIAKKSFYRIQIVGTK